MAHRRSPARAAKRARIAALLGAPGHHFAKLKVPREALAKLEAAIVGKVFVPGMPGYDAARQEANPAFQAYPQIIVYCAVPGDVAACLEVALNNQLAPAVRSGGHSSAGYSVNDGIVIDMSSFTSISMDAPGATLTVDAVGCWGTPDEFFEDLRSSGVRVLVYNPVRPWRLRHARWIVNRRNHRMNRLLRQHHSYQLEVRRVLRQLSGLRRRAL